jgi:small subunit ribosomal protein S16
MINRFCQTSLGIYKSGGAMSAKIRLKKLGTKKRPCYRIVVMDSRAARDGRAIEELGYYHPVEAEDKQLVINVEKVKEWMQKGVAVSDTVRSLLNRKARTAKE